MPLPSLAHVSRYHRHYPALSLIAGGALCQDDDLEGFIDFYEQFGLSESGVWRHMLFRECVRADAPPFRVLRYALTHLKLNLLRPKDNPRKSFFQGCTKRLHHGSEVAKILLDSGLNPCGGGQPEFVAHVKKRRGCTCFHDCHWNCTPTELMLLSHRPDMLTNLACLSIRRSVKLHLGIEEDDRGDVERLVDLAMAKELPVAGVLLRKLCHHLEFELMVKCESILQDSDFNIFEMCVMGEESLHSLTAYMKSRKMIWHKDFEAWYFNTTRWEIPPRIGCISEEED